MQRISSGGPSRRKLFDMHIRAFRSQKSSKEARTNT